jgi:hypothetical protein
MWSFECRRVALHCCDPLQEKTKTCLDSANEKSRARTPPRLHTLLLNARLSMTSIGSFGAIKSRTVLLLLATFKLVATSIWGKSVSKLEGSATRTKSMLVSRDCVKIPKKLLKIIEKCFKQPTCSL